jgi:hypothetical protein
VPNRFTAAARSAASRRLFDSALARHRPGAALLGRQLALDQVGEPLLEPLDLAAAALQQLAAGAALLQAAALGDELAEALDQAGYLWTGAARAWHAPKAAIRIGSTQCGLPEGSGAENRTSLGVL